MSAPAISRGRLSYWAVVIVLFLAIYVLVPQLKAFRSSWHLLQQPDLAWAGLAIGATVLTYFAAAITYCLLSFKPLRYLQTVVVQFAAMFINRLLPGGIGALGANYAYLHRRRHSAAQATTVVAVNNLLGLVGHGLLLVAALLLLPQYMGDIHWSASDTLLKMLAVTTLLLILTLVIWGRRRVVSVTMALRSQIITYRRRPGRLIAALGSSITLTLCNVLCLLFCALALGVHLPFVTILVIFTFGIGAGTVTPTPGGLGGFEAGLTAGLIAYHVASPIALAIALLYRLVSYWLPLLPGGVALLWGHRRRYFSI